MEEGNEEKALIIPRVVVDDDGGLNVITVSKQSSCCRLFCNTSRIIGQFIAAILALSWIIFMLFLITQSIDDIHNFIINNIDESATKPQPDATTDCSLKWENIKSRLDIFLIFHFITYYIASFIIRNRRILWTNSILWELVEFVASEIDALKLGASKECWWDSIIFDILIMNALGIELGLLTMKFMNWLFRKKLQIWEGMRIYSDFNTVRLTRWCCWYFIIWVTVGIMILKQLLSFIIFRVVFWMSPASILSYCRELMLVFVAFYAVSQLYDVSVITSTSVKCSWSFIKETYWLIILNLVVLLEIIVGCKGY